MMRLKSLSDMLGINVFLKLEMNNIGGSIKDRTAKEIILKALERGDISSGDNIIEGTSGSTGIALSLIANVKNLTSSIILPDNLAREKYKLLELFNANLIKVPPRNFIDENNFIRAAKDFKCSTDQKSFYCDQFENFDNFWVHFNETGPEIYEQLNQKVEYFVCSAGTSGTISGVSKFLKSKIKNHKTILADCEGSSLFSYVSSGVLHADQEREINKRKTPDYTIVEGIGQNRITDNFLRGSFDMAFKAGDLESMHMAHFLIKNEGLFLGGSSALNLVAVCKMVRNLKEVDKISVDELKKMNVVTIGNDSGYRYLSKFYDTEYAKKYGIHFEKLKSYDNLDFIDYDFN